MEWEGGWLVDIEYHKPHPWKAEILFDSDSSCSQHLMEKTHYCCVSLYLSFHYKSMLDQ